MSSIKLLLVYLKGECLQGKGIERPFGLAYKALPDTVFSYSPLSVFRVQQSRSHHSHSADDKEWVTCCSQLTALPQD